MSTKTYELKLLVTVKTDHAEPHPDADVCKQICDKVTFPAKMTVCGHDCEVTFLDVEVQK